MIIGLLIWSLIGGINDFESSRFFIGKRLLNKKKDNGLINIDNIHSLRISYLNITSIRNKLNDFEIFVSMNRTHIFIVGETWLKSGDEKFYNIPGYQTIFSNRDHKIGGGVCFFIRDGLDFDLIRSRNFDDSNIILIKLIKFNFSICGFYRAPQTKLDLFLNEIENISDGNNRILFLGDINVDLLKLNDRTRNNYMSKLGSNGLTIINTLNENFYTHNVGTHFSIIDHIFHDLHDCDIKFSVHTVNFSNHRTITADVILPKKMVLSSNEREITYVDYRGLNDELESVDFGTMDYDTFILIFSELIAHNIMRRKVSVKVSIKKNWINNNLFGLIKRRNLLRKRLSRDPNNIDLRDSFKSLKNSITNLSKRSKAEYFDAQFVDALGNNKKTWGIINHLLYNRTSKSGFNNIKLIDSGHIIDDTMEICNTFNNYFINVAPDLQASLDRKFNLKKREYTSSFRCSNTIFINPVTELEIVTVICGLKRNTSSGPNGISVNVIKNCPNLVPIFTHFVNVSFETGIFPESLKFARITPVHKGESKFEKTNYRPISVLNVDSKIFEKCIYDRLYSFLEKNNYLNKLQFGFLKRSNTAAAIINFITRILSNLNDGRFVASMFLDLAKAFDCLNHSLLFKKLFDIGIRGMFLKLLQSYFSNRKQRVQIGKIFGDYLKIVWGVPQGSILAPLLFVIYINDIFLLELRGIIQSFADDKSASYCAHSLAELFADMEYDLKILINYLYNNFLTLNIKKSCYMIYNVDEGKISNCQVKIDSQLMQRVSEAKYLGLIVDSKLKFDSHVDYIHKKIVPFVGAFRRLTHVKYLSVLKNLYYSFIHSHLLYLNPIWSVASKQGLKRLEILQNKSIRYLFWKSYKFNEIHTIDLYKKFDILTFDQMIKYELILLLHKLQTENLRSSIGFTYNCDVHKYNTRNRNNLHISRVTNRFGEDSILFRGAKLYNSLPMGMKDIKDDMKKFGKELRTNVKGDSL